MLTEVTVESGASAESVLSLVEPPFMLSLLLGLWSLLAPLVSPSSYSAPIFPYVYHRLLTTEKSARSQLLNRLTGLSSNRSGNCGSVDSESPTRRILYSACTHVRRN